MKNPFLGKTLAAAAVLAVIAAVAWIAPTGADDSDSALATSTFAVEGMTCGGCEAGVKLKVKKLDGVESVEASWEAGRATVTYHPDRVGPNDIVAAIEELGYTAELVDEAAG